VPGNCHNRKTINSRLTTTSGAVCRKKSAFKRFCDSLFFCFNSRYVCLSGLIMHLLMKKMLLLLVLGIGLGSCTAENDESFVQYGNLQKNINQQTAVLPPSCFTGVAGKVHVDVSNGIGNPIVVFTPVITGTVSPTASYRVKLQVQPLADCDDMNSNTGNLLTFGTSIVQNVNAVPPAIQVLPANMPLCYKWRFVFEGIVNYQRNPICYSESVWYESPLF